MARSEVDATRAIDTKLGQQLAGQALPFAGAAAFGGAAWHALDAPEGARAVPLALGILPWRLQGALRLTAVVKASFSIAGDEPSPIAADPLHVRDVHYKNRPLAHVVAASDRVPWKTAVDVTLLGHAHAPGGRPVTEGRARFALAHGGAVLFDKTVRVLGDRRSAGDAPAPFTAIPIVYERAHGGVDVPANPIGASAADDEHPNVVDPVNPWRPVGFGPLAAAWPLRNKLLGSMKRGDLDAPVVELPAGFAFAYFQSAPPDQQLSTLPADAVMLLEGFHPERERIQIALPAVRIAGAVYGIDDADPDAPSALAFRLDTLHVDADRLVVTLAWRALAHLPGEAQIDRLAFAAGACLGARDPVVPPRRPAHGARAASASQVEEDRGERAGTGTLLPQTSASKRGATLPFASASATLALPEESAPAASAVPLPPLPAPVAPADAPPPAPRAGPAPAPSALFHDLSKLPAPGSSAPAVEPPPAPPPEEIALERYAVLACALSEPDAERGAVLEAAGVDAALFRTSERRWQKALEDEARRGAHTLRDRFDDAYVRAWEERHPERFGAAGFARLRQAEARGLLQAELGDMRLDAAIGMRLRRVWRRRVASDAAAREAVERARAELRGG